MRDKRGIERGDCLDCDCEEYEPLRGSHRCDYCDHPSAKHRKIGNFFIFKCIYCLITQFSLNYDEIRGIFKEFSKNLHKT